MRRFFAGKVIAGGLAIWCLSCHSTTAKKWPLVIVLGIDGMDPQFVSQHLNALPNLCALARQGEFKRLQTTMPPQSPVAWSTFSTGLDPNKHGIFDFVYRDPRTMTAFSAMGETEEPFHISIGPYKLPLGSPHVKKFRTGKVFWKVLADAGVPVKILRMPVNYPPETSRGESLAGMGVPDMRGTFGTFTFYTDDPAETKRELSGGDIVPVQIRNDRALLAINGPANPFKREKTLSTVTMTVDIDPFENAARFLVQGHSFILRGGEWSNWIPVDFSIIPKLKDAHGMFRVYAKGFRPEFQVYLSPVNFNPLEPDTAISIPASYSAEIARKIGLFYTQGMAEETSAYRHDVFNRQEYLAQAQRIAEEQIKLLKYGLVGFHQGFFFLHISVIDQNSHMLWKKFDADLLETYQLIDGAIGWVMRNDPQATLIVMSDHGFTAFGRTVNLNTWLRQQGFLQERKDTSGGDNRNLFPMVNWSKTSAYALGLNAIYLNLAGRERNGTIQRSTAAQALRALSDQLLTLRDPENGRQVVIRTWSPHPDFHGDITHIPDLIVGFAPGYRSSWEGSLGSMSGSVLADNHDAWIGDHCMSPEFVPGVLISSRKSRVADPRLKDLTVSILNLYGLRPPEAMNGKALY